MLDNHGIYAEKNGKYVLNSFWIVSFDRLKGVCDLSQYFRPSILKAIIGAWSSKNIGCIVVQWPYSAPSPYGGMYLISSQWLQCNQIRTLYTDRYPPLIPSGHEKPSLKSMTQILVFSPMFTHWHEVSTIFYISRARSASGCFFLHDCYTSLWCVTCFATYITITLLLPATNRSNMFSRKSVHIHSEDEHWQFPLL